MRGTLCRISSHFTCSLSIALCFSNCRIVKTRAAVENVRISWFEAGTAWMCAATLLMFVDLHWTRTRFKKERFKLCHRKWFSPKILPHSLPTPTFPCALELGRNDPPLASWWMPPNLLPFPHPGVVLDVCCPISAFLRFLHLEASRNFESTLPSSHWHLKSTSHPCAGCVVRRRNGVNTLRDELSVCVSPFSKLRFGSLSSRAARAFDSPYSWNSNPQKTFVIIVADRDDYRLLKLVI